MACDARPRCDLRRYVEVAEERRPPVTCGTLNVSLKAEIAHDSAIARIRIVDCRPDYDCCGPDESATAPTLVLPLRGIFVKHRGTHTRIVADVCHALFFNADEPYRVSHPVTGGDQCPFGIGLRGEWRP